MAVTPTTAPKPTPDLFQAEVSKLLSGQLHLSPEMVTTWLVSTGLTVMLVATLTLVAVRAYGVGVEHLFKLINTNLKPDAVARVTQRTATLSGIVRSVGKLLICFLGAVIVLSKIGVNVAPILASAGILGLAVGFGAQSLVKDVISGFFIIVEDQYGVGDVIEANGKSGLVERMNLRITQLRTQDGALITIPNGEIKMVVNQSKEWARTVLEVAVDNREDPERVMAVLKALGAEIQAEMPEKIIEPIEVLGIEAFRESEVVIKLLIKTVPLEQWAVARALRKKIWYRFRDEQIAVPYPQRTFWLGSDSQESLGSLAMRATVPAPGPAEKQA